MPTTSTAIQLGTTAPAFSLPDVTSNRTVSLGEFSGAPALLVAFVCNHCPYVKHVEAELGRLGRDYAKQKVAIVAISANDATAHPDDAPSELRKQARRADWAFPYLYDESQAVARAYDAACTPEFYLFDKNKTLVYHGRLDESRPKSAVPVTGRDLRASLDAVLAGRPVAREQVPSIGCGIKWKAD